MNDAELEKLAGERAAFILWPHYETNSEAYKNNLADATGGILFALRAVRDASYGKGVSAGKSEALKYTSEEREAYGKWVAQASAPPQVDAPAFTSDEAGAALAARHVEMGKRLLGGISVSLDRECPKCHAEYDCRHGSKCPACGSLAASSGLPLKTFVVPGILKHPGRRKPQSVSLFLEAEDREDALWQAHHGVIEMNVRQSHPGSTITYDLRQMVCQSGGSKMADTK